MWAKAVRIARIGDANIRIDASWLLISALIVWSLATAYFPAKLPGAPQSTYLGMAGIAMLGVLGSLILHELAHVTMAGWLGVDMPHITLFLFGGVADVDPKPANYESEFWIAIAGPVASLCFAVACWLVALVAQGLGLPFPVQSVLIYLALFNLVLALLNLLPAFPTDGGRIVRAWFWARSGSLLAATRMASRLTAGIAYGAIIVGLFVGYQTAPALGLWAILVSVFLLSASHKIATNAEKTTPQNWQSVADLMTADPHTARPDQTLSHLVNRVFLERGVSFVPVVEQDVLLGYVDFQMVRKIDREHWTTTTVEDVIETASTENTVSPDVNGLDLLSRIFTTGHRKYMVANDNGLVGVITLSDLVGVLQLAHKITSVTLQESGTFKQKMR